MEKKDNKTPQAPAQTGLKLDKNKVGRPKKDRNDPFRAGLRGDLVPVNFQWDRETVLRMDMTAGQLGVTRSQLIRQILTEWLSDHEVIAHPETEDPTPPVYDADYEERDRALFNKFWDEMTEEQRAVWKDKTSGAYWERLLAKNDKPQR